MPVFKRNLKTQTTNKDNKSWWEKNPMNYQWENSSGLWINEIPDISEVNKDFFLKIDKKLNETSLQLKENYSNSPFEDLIEFKELNNKNILEIGCGFGTHAQEIIRNTNKCVYNGVDITNKAIEYTKKRLELFKLRGEITLADAEKLPFKENQFNFIWSWGVIHHSKSTENILQEIHRVLSKGGVCKVMVYHKNSLRYYLFGGFFLGILKGKLFQKSLEQINLEITDGYFARHFTKNEFKKILENFDFRIKKILILPDSDHLPFPGGYKLKKINFKLINKFINFLCKKFGWFLYAEFEKK